jgi:soluble lytic murein transglycosylase-like protein
MFNADLKLAVAGYNAGEGAVIKYNRTVPPYPETQNYVQQVLSLYAKSG